MENKSNKSFYTVLYLEDDLTTINFTYVPLRIHNRYHSRKKIPDEVKQNRMILAVYPGKVELVDEQTTDHSTDMTLVYNKSNDVSLHHIHSDQSNVVQIPSSAILAKIKGKVEPISYLGQRVSNSDEFEFAS